MTGADLRDTTAIVGVGTTSFMRGDGRTNPSLTRESLAADAFSLALEDAGLKKEEVDGLLVSGVPSYARMADVLGMRHLRFINGLDGSGRMSGFALQTAVMAIATGVANVVACVYGNNSKSAGATFGGESGDDTPYGTAVYDKIYGMTSPGASAALQWVRYQHRFGAPDGGLAPLAMSNRKHGALNPNAYLQKEVTYEEYMASRFIAEPLRLFDYCLINDGGVAFIVTSAERARTLRKPPVYVRGMAMAGHIGDLTSYYDSDDFFYAGCKDAADRLYAAAGMGPKDVDCAQIYDNFTPMALFALEGFGHAPRGEGWEWIKNGRTALGGELPVNTSGGHTSESYMQGWALHVEAVRQLRGEAGARQVKNCETVQYMAALPIVTSHILRK